MKKVIFVATVLICTYAISFSQIKTPDAVTATFNQKFPDATSVKWDKEHPHEYEAEFDRKGEKHSASFNASGEWLETENPYAFNQLPEKVQAAFNASHKGETVKAIAKIETSKGTTKYEVEFKQGVKTVELFYSADGTEIKE